MTLTYTNHNTNLKYDKTTAKYALWTYARKSPTIVRTCQIQLFIKENKKKHNNGVYSGTSCAGQHMKINYEVAISSPEEK